MRNSRQFIWATVRVAYFMGPQFSYSATIVTAFLMALTFFWKANAARFWSQLDVTRCVSAWVSSSQCSACGRVVPQLKNFLVYFLDQDAVIFFSLSKRSFCASNVESTNIKSRYYG